MPTGQPNRTPLDGSRPSRFGRFLMLSLVCGSLAMVAAVWGYYRVQKRETETATMGELFAVARGKTDQIANWRRERIGDGRVVMASPVMRGIRRILSARRMSAADRADALDLMRRMASQFLYADVTLVEMDGSVALRMNEETTEGAQFVKHSRGELAREAVKAGDVLLSDLRPDTRWGHPMMALTIPIADAGAMILDIDPSHFLYPYLESWPGRSRTAESLLVRLEGNEIVILSKPRNESGSTLFSRRKQTQKLPRDAVLDSGWAMEGADYRGVPVLATIRRVADSPWLLICKIDAAEVDTPVRRLGWEMALVIALLALANAAIVGLIWRGREARAHSEREAWFYAIANDTPAYLWMASPEYENSFINQPLGTFLGTGERPLSTAWSDYVHPDDAGRARARFLECLKAHRAYTDEFRLRRFDGEYRLVINEAVPRFSPRGDFLGFAGSVLDITDRRNAEDQLHSANDALASQLEEEIRKEREIQELSARLIGAQEEERKRLARELHDDLNQQIAALSIAMGNLKRHIPEEQADSRAQSDRIHERLVHVAETVRRLSHELHPAILQYSGLAAALRSYCNEFGAVTGVHVSVAIDGEFDGVPQGAALCLYRITQEALRNVSKHAKVAAATVTLCRADGVLSLAIADRGAGIDPALRDAAAGLGLISIRERTRLAGGTLQISSIPNEGTTIRVQIPIA